MIRSISFALSLAGVAALLSFAGLRAQGCSSPTGRFLQNDNLPVVPPAVPTGVSIIRGLCVNEAAFTVFDNVNGMITVDEVSCLFAAQGGVAGNLGVADIEIYDGVTENAGGLGRYQLGPLLWSLSGSGNANLQMQSTAINTLSLRNFGTMPMQGPSVNVTSGKLVVAIRMLINPNGGCAFGYSSNLATDFSGLGASCPTPGVNGIISLNNGAFDPGTFPFPGAGGPLCGLGNFYGGNWVIRACITEATPPALTSWQGFPQPGGAVLIQLDARSAANDGYVTLLGGSINVGTPLPWGTWPLDLDPWLNCFLGPCRGLLSNGQGALDANGRAITTLLIPADPSLVGSGITWYASYFAYDPMDFFNWTAIGAASTPIIIN